LRETKCEYPHIHSLLHVLIFLTIAQMSLHLRMRRLSYPNIILSRLGIFVRLLSH
jgi:hypothetical protein